MIRFVLLSLFLVACSGSIRDNARMVANAAAGAANSGGEVIVSEYCRASMRAIGRDGRIADGRCVESGPNAGRAATEAELAELARVRQSWRPVIEAHEGVVQSHGVLRAALEASDAARDGQLLTALGRIAEAYDSLRRAARLVNVSLPSLLPGGAR